VVLSRQATLWSCFAWPAWPPLRYRHPPLRAAKRAPSAPRRHWRQLYTPYLSIHVLCRELPHTLGECSAVDYAQSENLPSTMPRPAPFRPPHGQCAEGFRQKPGFPGQSQIRAIIGRAEIDSCRQAAHCLDPLWGGATMERAWIAGRRRARAKPERGISAIGVLGLEWAAGNVTVGGGNDRPGHAWRDD
jgi:hypothetical protein